MKISSNVKPFTRADSHFTNTRFFEDDDAPKETMKSTINSNNKGGTKNILQVPKKDIPTHQFKKKESK